ncbi:glycine zipper 2TM domain-containing protein [Mitsuaria sp. WAJ17]|uniref:glycine zipper 2TM domain-containing protein n=1 Tax=Mitsuaria sp. WAJ17 TaxID=2761452 RepID=UPI0015FECEFF|nr:glycine zipper 2TM domain-containing protein [Mitsuaria sp. WAJ17]MBB2487154.1 glycine zipper 2TM domain-containing protein [Mitsuaria sp. WAJ17]
MKIPFSSSQIIAGVLGAGVLLAGAFAVGRASSPAAAPTPLAAPVVEADAGASAKVPPKQAAADTRGGNAAAKGGEPGRQASPSASASPALCAECARVVEVHEETRQGKASGIGAVGGAVLGGLLGNQVGGGTGKKIATIGGAVAGGYAGNEIEKRQKSHRVWIVRLNHADGSTQRLEQGQDPGLRAGDVVVVRDGRIERRER